MAIHSQVALPHNLGHHHRAKGQVNEGVQRMKSTDTTGSCNTSINSSNMMQVIDTTNDLIHEFRLDKQVCLIISIILCVSFFLFNCILQTIIHFGLFEELYFKLNLDSGGFRIHHGGSIPELFNYLQTTICVGLLLGVFRATRQPVYGAWDLIFLFVVLALLCHI